MNTRSFIHSVAQCGWNSAVNSEHDAYREAAVPFAPLDVDNKRFGPKTEPRIAANDDPKYIRTPELDHRVKRGDRTNSNAWFDTVEATTVFFMRGYDPNERRWLKRGDPRWTE